MIGAERQWINATCHVLTGGPGLIPAVGKTSAIQMDFSLSRHKVVGLNGARHNKQSHLANPSSIQLIIILAVTIVKARGMVK